MPDRDVIRLKNAVFYAYHGAMDDEQNLGGKFEVDLEMYSDLSRAAESDSLRKTIDYEKVYSVIQRIILAKNYRLLEALAGTLAKGLIEEFPDLEAVTVRIRKPHPPVKGVVDYVEVEISQRR
ncbi:MAG: dihydroneopterin aldolase [Bacteroidota bacterium]